MEAWGPDRLEDVAGLVQAAFPAEEVAAPDLAAVLWGDPDPGLVLAAGNGSVVAAAVLRQGGAAPVAALQLLAVAPGARRSGLATAALSAVERWAADQGAAEVLAGQGAPYYLWPGVDFSWTAALCLFESAGWETTGAALDMVYAASFRAPLPPGVVVARAGPADAEGLAGFCRRHWPQWEAELGRGIERGAVFAATEGDAVAGFACHSVNRAGVFGPMATDPGRRGTGIGSALLGAVAADLNAAGRDRVPVSWVGPVTFYVKAADATAHRVYRLLRRRL